MSWKDSFPKDNRYFETENGILYCGDAVELLKQVPNESIDLVITSPPYDNLRYYNAKNEEELMSIWNMEKFKQTAKELYRIVKRGGVVVWVVNDATIKGSETGNSFRQALYFKDECGFNLHDTMIFEKNNFSKPDPTRYWNIFEYMFIFSKGRPKTINFIEDRRNKKAGTKNYKGYKRECDGRITTRKPFEIKKFGKRTNIWKFSVGKGGSAKDEMAFKHPAIFPEQLAHDHIISWSNKTDLVLDPFIGSGTTAIACEKLNRKWIGIEINPEYCEIAKQRILNYMENRDERTI